MSDVYLRDITKRYQRVGAVVDRLNLDISDGEFFTLLGPSGCGKTTTLRMIAGFTEPTSGSIHFGDTEVTALPANKRNVGIVFQNYALFPHLSVAKNVGFGLRARHIVPSEIARRVAEVLDQVRMSDTQSRRVDELSGGQQQRIALARAVVIRPELLLLDEPLSNLDAKLREETRAALRTLHAQTGKTTVYVTHDQAEALAMSSRIAVMAHGRVHQVGTPQQVYQQPATRFVAKFLGRNNIIDGMVADLDGTVVTVRSPGDLTLLADTRQCTPLVTTQPGAAVSVSVRAELVRVVPATADGPNTFDGVVTDAEYIGPRLEISVTTALGEIRLELDARGSLLGRGDRVRLQIPVDATYLLEPEASSP